MAFKSSARLQGYQIKQIKEMFDEGAIEPACRLTAKHMARITRNNFRALTKNTGTGQLLGDIKAIKGKYDETTWLYGVLGDINPPGGSDAWLKSTGGRAHFFEYGRSAPGRGRGSGFKPDPVSIRAQPPRPFMRTTIATGRRQLKGVTSKELTKITKRIRTGKIPTTLIRNI